MISDIYIHIEKKIKNKWFTINEDTLKHNIKLAWILFNSELVKDRALPDNSSEIVWHDRNERLLDTLRRPYKKRYSYLTISELKIMATNALLEDKLSTNAELTNILHLFPDTKTGNYRIIHFYYY